MEKENQQQDIVQVLFQCLDTIQSEGQENFQRAVFCEKDT